VSVFLFINGQAVQPHQTSETLFDSRAWRYGDALFETMLLHKGTLLRAPLHAKRIAQGAKALGMTPSALSAATLLPASLYYNIDPTTTYRIRFTLVRAGGGLYLPQTAQTDTFISAAPYLHFSGYFIHYQGIKVVLYPIGCLVYTPWSAYKTANALPFVMASQYAAQHHADDALLCNTQGNWTCGTSSNLFVYVPSLGILTPPLSEGCVDGIVRRRLLQLLPVTEQPITSSILAQAQAVWLTNTTKGIRWVHTIGEHIYTEPTFLESIIKEI
jgi:branched-subunit amino acid aminotransferase/4-amino-4-deoxychorismate lyase